MRYVLLAVLALFIVVDAHAQVSVHRADVHAVTDELMAVRESLSRIVVDPGDEAGDAPRFVERARADLAIRVDELISELTLLRNRFARNETIEERHVRPPLERMEAVRRSMDSIEGVLEQIGGGETPSGRAATALADASDEIRYVFTRLRPALRGLY